ncbi:hypothetical protein PILCRDRAFT_82226 [Piloderma croceum F 1598]|uniref:Reverse transcriptase zinc-binding domain-containing protein n=1 Tax=Piloderma croceum (strain F 1598) TaxID=765440 RepID=A0A0C3EW52_PILCF|nr:hypothetical protein PILCRDRAFT_82226 [Piloderma croceum F 1598]
MIPIVSHLRERGAITTFQCIKNHGPDHNRAGAEHLATLSTEKQPDNLNLQPKKSFHLTGAQLSHVSQALVYKGICELSKAQQRLATTINLDITRHAVQSMTGSLSTDATIWHSIQNKDITRIVRVFLWKILHNTHKCGDYWLNIPTFEHRASCHNCQVPDSMNHILTECNAPGQKEVWSLAKTLWLKKHDFWPSIVNTGSIVGCGLGKFKSAKGQHKPGANRLYRILLSESAYLIWKIRCERLLVRSNEEQWHSPKEIQNRWLHAMNKRLQFDCAMTNRRFEKKALADDVVLQTWSGTLHNEHSLPDNWIQESGVLAGIGSLEPLRTSFDPP